MKVNDVNAYHLWDRLEKPFYKENDLVEYEDFDIVRRVWNVTEPTLTIYAAEHSPMGVIVIPGGGYEFEAIDHEGYVIANALAGKGITSAVLKYRLPHPKSSDRPQFVPLSDVRQALTMFRQITGLTKLGLLGFSAGSHLAAVASLSPRSDPAENPDFTGLIYGVTTPSDANRDWLERCLYFRHMTVDELAFHNLLERVTPQTPPTFLAHAYDDTICPVEESTLYADSLRRHGVLAEMHLFPKGGHGFGLGREEDGTGRWLELFVNWLLLHVRWVRTGGRN